MPKVEALQSRNFCAVLARVQKLDVDDAIIQALIVQ